MSSPPLIYLLLYVYWMPLGLLSWVFSQLCRYKLQNVLLWAWRVRRSSGRKDVGGDVGCVAPGPGRAAVKVKACGRERAGPQWPVAIRD